MYFHFTSLDGKLAFGDNRQVIVGETLAVDGDVRFGRWGLHAATSVAAALRYSNGLRLWGVDFPKGIAVQSEELVVGSARSALRDFGDVSALVVEFAQDCAAAAKGYASAYAAASAYADAAAAYAAAAYAAADADAAADASASASAYADAAADAASAYAAECERQQKWWEARLGVGSVSGAHNTT